MSAAQQPKDSGPKKPTMMTLAAEKAGAIQKVIDQGGEVLPEDDAAIAAADAKLEDKFEAYLAVIDRLAAERDQAKAEASVAAGYAKSCDTAIDNLRARMLTGLKVAGQQKIKAGYRTVSILAGRQRLVITDVKALPIDYVREVTDFIPDCERIKTALIAGQEINGARFETGAESVQVRSPRGKSKDEENNPAEAGKEAA